MSEEFDQKYEIVEVKHLKEHPQNPNRGKTEIIDDSIEQNGWYGAVIAQTSTGYVLAGNHRLRVAKERGWKTLPTIWRDVDDQTALRILLVDNEATRAGEYDQEVLEEILNGLETLDGTGFGLDLDELAEEPREGEEGLGEVPEEVPDDVYTPSYGVMVVCEDEAHQEKVYEALAAEGHQVRVVAV